eukprot:8867811-Ditylum_brightwellii.AAC.1
MKDSIGQTALIMLQWVQLAAGTSVPVLEDAGRLPYLEGSWIASISDGLITINAKIHIPCQWVRKPQRIGDMAIMEVFHITTSDGTRLIPAVYTQCNGEPLKYQQHTMMWPRQDSPWQKYGNSGANKSCATSAMDMAILQNLLDHGYKSPSIGPTIGTTRSIQFYATPTIDGQDIISTHRNEQDGKPS